MKRKTIEIDWDNYEELNKLFNQVKSRKLELEPGRVTKRELQSKTFGACLDIIEYDISDLYENLNSPGYYVYAHCDPTNENNVNRSGVGAFAASMGMRYYPFYIGKGKGNRAFNLNRNETHRKVKQKIASFNKEPEVVIIKDNLTEGQALALESKLIDIFGILSKGGKLCNLDEGRDSELRMSRYKDKLGLINKFHLS